MTSIMKPGMKMPTGPMEKPGVPQRQQAPLPAGGRPTLVNLQKQQPTMGGNQRMPPPPPPPPSRLGQAMGGMGGGPTGPVNTDKLAGIKNLTAGAPVQTQTLAPGATPPPAGPNPMLQSKPMKKGGAVKKSTPKTPSASKRADGCAIRGKTKGRFA